MKKIGKAIKEMQTPGKEMLGHEDVQHIVDTPVGAIKPYGKNAKKHTGKQVARIADSIKEFGFNQPIVVDKEGIIIVGHGRYMASTFLGLESVPVVTLDLSEEKAKAYRLADNKLNESDWDMQLVIAELKELTLEMVDLTGFDRKLVVSNYDREDDVPNVPEKARTNPGDVYGLNGHRIICGDSTKTEDMARLAGLVKADMVFTDPPYNVNYKGSGENTSQGIMNDKMDTAKFRAFLVDAFAAMKTVVKQGAGLYIFHSDKTQFQFEDALTVNEIEIKNQLIWNKPSGGMGMGDYRGKHEPFFYAHMKGAKPLFYGDRTNVTVVDLHKTDLKLLEWAKAQREAETQGRTTIWTMKRERVDEYVHPTQKPVELIMYAIHNSSKVDDVVLDPFLGSGSTVVACEKTNRICYGSELDPRYVDVIIERWCEFTGNRNITLNGKKIVW